MRGVLRAAIGTALGLLFLTVPASAQFLTFVSAAGNDANTCFVQAAPCKTLQRGINQTSAGGEVRLLTSLTSNGFINKSLTIEGGQNTVIGTIAVNSASAIVRFKRLNLNGRHAFPDGFNIINAAAVHIEECSAERYTGTGIVLGANVSTELVVSNSVSRDNGSNGIALTAPTTATLTVEDSSFDNNGTQGILLQAGQGSIARSTFLANAKGILVLGGTTTAAEVTAASNNDLGFQADSSGQLSLISCDALGNANQGILISNSATGRVSDCTIVDNDGDGIENLSSTVLSRGNNLVAGNTPETSGTITPLAGE